MCVQLSFYVFKIFPYSHGCKLFIGEMFELQLLEQEIEMSKKENKVEAKVGKLEKELEWLEAKFHRSGIDSKVRMKTLLRMQKLTHDFLIWFARKDIEKSQKRAKEAEN